MSTVADIEPLVEAGPDATPEPTPRTIPTRVELRQFDINSFRLLQTRFRLVQDYPFNR